MILHYAGILQTKQASVYPVLSRCGTIVLSDYRIWRTALHSHTPSTALSSMSHNIH